MPVAGSGAGTKGGKKGGRGPILTVPVAPAPVRNSGPVRPSAPATAPATTPLGAGKSGTSASSSSSSTPDYYAQQKAEQRKRDMATRDRYIGDAEQMAGQIRALRHTLGRKGDFKDALKKRLDNIETVLGEQLADLDKTTAARANSLDADMANNRKAAADSSIGNDTNRIRERASSITEAMAQGAGESDTLRAQMMSLRNFDANQDEINRSFHDSQRSINQGRLDLALDSHNARVNMVTEANADKETLWSDYYAQTSEAQTQLGNALGQQAEYYGLALEAQQNAGGGGKGKGKGKDAGKGKGGGKDGGKGRNLGIGRAGDADVNVGGPGAGRPNGRPKAGSAAPQVGGLAQPTGPGPGYIPGKGGTRFDPEMGGGGGGGGRGAFGIRRSKFAKGLKGDEAFAAAQSDRAFLASAKTQGRVWDNPGLPKDLQDWQPPTFTEEQLNNGSLSAARTNVALAKPEGATLRKW